MTRPAAMDGRTPTQRAQSVASEAQITLGLLMEAWPWLADMAIPGPAGPIVAMYVTAEQRQIERDQHRKDAAAKFDALKAGTTPTPHPDAARAGPVAARATVASMVRHLTERIWAFHRDGQVLAWPIVDPTTRRHKMACWYCQGNHRAYIPDPLEPGGVTKGTCPQCLGAGEVPTGDTCGVCFTGGACSCDLADAVMAAAADILGYEIDHVTDVTAADDLLRTLDRANTLTRRAAKASEAHVHLRAACPACGRRELVAEVSSPDRARWTIRCRSELCVCKGRGCRCGRADSRRMPDRPHVWSAVEWDGPKGLATRLGVDMPPRRRRDAS